MKKILSTLAVVVMLFASTFMLVACFGDNGDGTYKVNISTCQHGIITVDKSSAKEGEKVTVTPIAETGYELMAITCNGVAMTNYEITMPKNDITLSALFRAKENQGGTESVERINLNLGTYVCMSEYELYEGGDYSYERKYYIFNTLTFKEGNKVDVTAYMSGNEIPSALYSINDILYTREGNTLTGTFNGMTAKIQIVDSNNIVVIYDSYYMVMTHKGDTTIQDGKYSATIGLEGSEYIGLEVTFNGNNIAVKYTYHDTNSQDHVTEGSTNYRIVGNRIILTIGNTTYCAIVSEGNQYLKLSDLCEIDSEGIYMVLEENTEYLLTKVAA